MLGSDRVRLDRRANAGILQYLTRGRVDGARLPAASRPSAELNRWRLGTHPDLVARLWDELAPPLPEDCRYVVEERPALVHPRSGVIFAVAGGTIYMLRLPADMREEAIRAGARRRHSFPAYPALGVEASDVDLADIGEGWLFGAWLSDEGRWCGAAYEFAGLGA